MSRQYKHSSDVPSSVLADRLDELVKVITDKSLRPEQPLPYEFYMRIPAEVDHDADIVMSEAARRLRAPRQVSDEDVDRAMEIFLHPYNVGYYKGLRAVLENYEANRGG